MFCECNDVVFDDIHIFLGFDNCKHMLFILLEKAIYGKNMFGAGKVICRRYRTYQIIGKGGMGIVYRGVDEETGQPVAIKVLRPERSNPVSIERFRREAELVSAIGHRNICEVRDISAHRGMPFYVMPLLKGLTLESLIGHREIPFENGCNILRQFLAGLTAAHDKDIVHRDLKPSNIFLILSAWDTDAMVKIMDFGVSKMLGASAGRITETGVSVGTARYMAPEQAGRAKYVDCRADVYAAGLITYEMFAGCGPFEENLFGGFDPMSPRPCKPIQSRNPDVPDSVSAVIMKALKRDPAARYANAREMSAAFEAALTDPGPNADAAKRSRECQTYTRIPRVKISKNE
jgi:eukaryotic-like serine/threonine-protein kinase